MELKFPQFENIKVSTKTFIVLTNLEFDKEMLFSSMPISKYIVVPKKRGRKKKVPQEDPNKDLKQGSIITVKYEKKVRGVDLKKKASSKVAMNNKRKYWRNSVTIVINVEGKLLNVKISSNGKFQMTGCKTDIQAEKCIEYIWSYLKDLKGVYTFKGVSRERKLEAIFVQAMRNIDFALGFKVNRENLDKYINLETDYTSLLETSFGYTGVNIKLPVEEGFEPQLKKIVYTEEGEKKSGVVPYSNYLDQLKEKERNKKLNKPKYNTFLVFHSGKIIMSGRNAGAMKPSYNRFTALIQRCFHRIEEKLDT